MKSRTENETREETRKINIEAIGGAQRNKSLKQIKKSISAQRTHIKIHRWHVKCHTPNGKSLPTSIRRNFP